MYSNGFTDDSGNEWSDNQHYYGAALRFRNDKIKTSLILEEKSQDKTVKGSESKYVVNYGIEYDLGSFTPMFSYRYVSQNGSLTGHKVGLSAKIPAGHGAFKVAATYLWGHDESKSDETKVNSWSVGVAYEYPLSKRTVLKPFIGYAKSGQAWKDDTVLNVANVRNAWQGYLGLHHFF